MMTCDACGTKCSRLHNKIAFGMECSICDYCAGYDAEAYGDEPDDVLAKSLAGEVE